jgi:hypothetical protein
LELTICGNRCPLDAKLFEVLSQFLDVVDDALTHPQDRVAWVFAIIKALLNTTFQRFQFCNACSGSGFVCALHPADGYAFTLQQVVSKLLRCCINPARAIIYPFELLSSSYP